MSGPLIRRLMLLVASAALIAGVLIAVLVSGGGDHARGGRAGVTAKGRSDVQVAADYLGISAPALRRRLRNGETMAQIAGATAGRSQSGLIQAVLAPRAVALRGENLPAAEQQIRLDQARHRI